MKTLINTDTVPSVCIKRRCELLRVSRTLHYYKPNVNAYNLVLMRIIDEQYLKTPCYGAERMTAHLNRMGHFVNVKRIRRLMRIIGILPIYPKKRTSIGTDSHKKYPYLLKDLPITHPNQVWCADVTYIPLHRGFMYLVVVMDWYSRKVLSWGLSNALDESFCVEALSDALRMGRPEIFNTDQGSQFTGKRFTATLIDANVRISMDGKGRWLDNVMVERLWRTLKYEYIYLNAFEGGSELNKGLTEWFRYYNNERIHSSLDWATPDEVYNKEIRFDLSA